LLDYVTLQFNLQREVFEEAAASFFKKVGGPVHKALEEAGLKVEEID